LKLSDVDKIELFTHARSQVKQPSRWFPPLHPIDLTGSSPPIRQFIVNYWRLVAKKDWNPTDHFE
jgi:hypothetical protein